MALSLDLFEPLAQEEVDLVFQLKAEVSGTVQVGNRGLWLPLRSLPMRTAPIAALGVVLAVPEAA